MSQPAEFSLESVRQLMLANGGRVTNHDLVQSFRLWLTDPVGKETARAQFKDYVNTLASIRQEGGKKYLILKKKFYPEYYNTGYVDVITPPGYQGGSSGLDSGYSSNGYNPPEQYNSTQYNANRKLPSGFYEPSGSSSKAHSGSSYSSQIGSSYSNNVPSSYSSQVSSYVQQEPGSSPYSSSGVSEPSMLDEVMAGFMPPSRTMGRKLPAIPSQQSGGPNSVGLPSAGLNSVGLPVRKEGGNYQTKNTGGSSYQSPPVGPSYHTPNSGVPSYQSQHSGGSSYPSPPVNNPYQPQPVANSYPSQPTGSAYQSPSSGTSYQSPSSGSSYQSPTSLASHPSSYHRQASVDSLRGKNSDPGPTHPRGTSDLGLPYSRGTSDLGPPYTQQPDQHQRHSVASHASHNSYSSGSPHPTPPASLHSSNSPRGSYAPPGSYGSGSPRTSMAPPFSNSPRSSYALPTTSTRPPPPYRAPPPDPAIQTRPLPDRPPDSHRPSELNISPSYLPADPVLPPVAFQSPPADPSPPPPPKRTVPSESQLPPPPLPRRPPPSSPAQPLDLLPPPNMQIRSKSTNIPPKLTESPHLQSSPTDSGFTEDCKLSDSPTPRSLSKSYGNLAESEDKENMYLSSKLEASLSLDQLDKECEQGISVRERTKTFNRMASETEIPNLSISSTNLSKLPSAVKRRNSRAIDFGSRRGSSNRLGGGDSEDTDSASITTIDPTVKKWMVAAAKGDYQTAARMLTDEPKLSRSKDFTTGYTALHWACKHGNADLVKLLAGTYQAAVDARSHGGYTPLHLAAQHNHQEVFDLLVQAYKADANLRDYAGKKPRQYMITSGDTGGLGLSMSSDTFRQLKDGGKNRTSRMEKGAPGILRFGSLSVKVKKTTEAFNNYFNSSGNESKPKWGSDVDTAKMPPPKFAPIKKRKSKRTIDFGRTKSAPVTPTERSPVKEVILEEGEEEGVGGDSDSEYGFGDKWGPGDRPGTTSQA